MLLFCANKVSKISSKANHVELLKPIASVVSTSLKAYTMFLGTQLASEVKSLFRHFEIVLLEVQN